MSGFSGDLIANEGVLSQEVHFLQKPFTSAELRAHLEIVLSDEGEGDSLG